MASRMVIQNGLVASLDPAQQPVVRADVLIENERIMAVGHSEFPTDATLGNTTVIDATGMLVIPGLIDAHRHTWQGVIKQVAPATDLNGYFGGILAAFAPHYRPDDVYIGTLLGALEAIDAGITTLGDWSHIQHTPAHTDAAIAALQVSGLRAVFGYGFPNTGPHWFYESSLPHPDDARRVRAQYFASDDQLVTMMMALRGPELSTMATTKHDWMLARELGLRISVHVGNGAFGVPYQAISHLAQADLLGPDIQYVHTTSLSDADLQRIADTGGTAVVTPAVEMQMGFGTPATGRLIAHGIRPGIGIDVVTSTASDLFTQMRALYQAERLRQLALPLHEQGTLLTPQDVLRLATIDGARSLGLDARVGTLTPGKAADVVLLRVDTLGLTPLNDPIAAVVLSVDTRHVDTVIIGGKVVKRHGQLLVGNLAQLDQQARASRDYLFTAAGMQMPLVG